MSKHHWEAKGYKQVWLAPKDHYRLKHACAILSKTMGEVLGDSLDMLDIPALLRKRAAELEALQEEASA